MIEKKEPGDLEDPMKGIDRTQDHLLLYDFFKQVTTITLLTLGGIIGFADRIDPEFRFIIFPVVALVALGGALSFDGVYQIAKGASTGKLNMKKLGWYRMASNAALMVGLGMFLAILLPSIAG